MDTLSALLALLSGEPPVDFHHKANNIQISNKPPKVLNETP